MIKTIPSAVRNAGLSFNSNHDSKAEKITVVYDKALVVSALPKP